MSTVVEQIEQQIAKLSTKAVKKNTGTIRAVADGVAKLDGLSEVMYNEMVQFPGGAIGIALNLEEDEVGCVVLGDVSNLKQGDECLGLGDLGLDGAVIKLEHRQRVARCDLLDVAENARDLLGRHLAVDETQPKELFREELGLFVGAHAMGQMAVSSLVAASL